MSAQALLGKPNVVLRPSTEAVTRTSCPEFGFWLSASTIFTIRLPYEGSALSRLNAVTWGESVRFTTWSATMRQPETRWAGSSRQFVHHERLWSCCVFVMRHWTHRYPGLVSALLCV